jgi:hypothetical protein
VCLNAGFPAVLEAAMITTLSSKYLRKSAAKIPFPPLWEINRVPRIVVEIVQPYP